MMRAAEGKASLSAALPERLYRSMRRIRRVEEEIARIYPSDRIKSPVHLSIGQEAVATGVCEALETDDVAFGTYRGHAMYLAKGGDLRRMMAELYGKAGGCAEGKGGSMHLVDVARGAMGTSAVVATTIPNAVGYAYALKLRRGRGLVVAFFGDGATEEGVFAESLNFAALKGLPILFVCENNGYAIHTHQSRRQARPDVCRRVEAFGVPASRVEDNDVLAIHERVSQLAPVVREGRPAFIECMTYRWLEHVGPKEDFGIGYRDRVEAQPWMQGDQVGRLGAMLPQTRRRDVDAQVEAEIRDAVAFAEASPFPGPDRLLAQVFREC